MEEQALKFRIVKYMNFESWNDLGYGWCVEQSSNMFNEQALFNKFKEMKIK